MSKKKRTEDPQCEEVLRSVRAKVDRFKRAMNGDADALVECMYNQGLCTKEQFEDYFRIKKKYGSEEEI